MKRIMSEFKTFERDGWEFELDLDSAYYTEMDGKITKVIIIDGVATNGDREMDVSVVFVPENTDEFNVKISSMGGEVTREILRNHEGELDEVSTREGVEFETP